MTASPSHTRSGAVDPQDAAPAHVHSSPPAPHRRHQGRADKMVVVNAASDGGGHTTHGSGSSFLDKLSIKGSDTASHAESTASAPAIVEKARKVKRKMKDKLHLGHHGEEHDEDYEDGDSFLDGENDDELPLAAVRDRSRTSTSTTRSGSSAERDRTLAQQYAEQYRAPDSVLVNSASDSPRSSGLATPLGAGDHSDDDDENIIILHSGNNKSAPNLLSRVQKGSAPGTPASIRALKSPPDTKDTASTSGSPARHRARSSVSLPASQSDWRRRAEFHNLFEGKVDEEEHLVSDYACAWVKDIFRQGRMYVGARNVAFNCGIIGLKCSVVLPYDDIAKIEKSVTARVIPNAITITTLQGDSYLFASFIYRDASYDLIMDCWQSKNPEAHATFMATQEIPAEADAAKDIDEEEGDKTVDGAAGAAETGAATSAGAAHPATECSGNHFSETVLDVKFPCEPEKIYKLLYQTPEFQESINSEMKLTEFEKAAWEPHGPLGLAKRDYSYIKPLSGSIGPSSAKCIIVEEELAKDAEKAFEVLSITRTPDVPSGGAFSVHTKTCLTWAGGGKCRMVVTTECVWTGRSMVKGIITSSSIAGQRAYNKDVASLINRHIQANPKEFGAQNVTAAETEEESSSTAAAIDGAATSSKSSTSNASAAGRSSGMFRSIVSSVQQSETVAAVLLVSNIALLALFVISMFTSGFPGKRKVQIVKTVLTEDAEKLALQRLSRMENSWKGLQACVEQMVKDSS